MDTVSPPLAILTSDADWVTDCSYFPISRLTLLMEIALAIPRWLTASRGAGWPTWIRRSAADVLHRHAAHVRRLHCFRRAINRWLRDHGFEGNCSCDSEMADRQPRSGLAYVDRLSYNGVV